MSSNQIQSNYYAIIPANVRYSKDLEPNAKLLYGEITALCNQEGYCWASNRYFSELYDVDETTIQRWLKSLKEKEFIWVEVEKQGMKTKRKIWISDTFKKMFTTPQKCSPRHRKNAALDTAKMRPIIIQCSNTTSKKKQQQEPIGSKVCDAAVAFFKCIEEIGLNDKEKRSLMKYPEDEVKKAVEFATHPETKIKTTLIKTIMWALKEKPDIPKLVDEEENYDHASSAEYFLSSKHWNFEAISKKAIIFSKNPNDTTQHEIKYSDPNFKEKCEKLLNQCGFKKNKS